MPSPSTRRRLSRRTLLGTGGAALGSALLLAACGGADPTGSAAPTGGAPAGVGFPVTLTDRFGTVTIPQAPTTIASVGRTDHDVLLALGIVPSTVYRFVPSMTRGVGVWAEPRLGAADPTVLTAPISIESVAATRPDLIVNVQSLGDEAEYRGLSGIAPTVGLPPNTAGNTVSWQESARIISTAVGRTADGERLVTDTEAVLAEAGADNPSFAGKTVSILLGAGGKLGIYGTTDSRTLVLTALGFTPSPYAAQLGAERFFYDVSPELVGQADADVVLMLTREGLDRNATLAAYPTLAQTSAATEGRLLVVEDVNLTLALSAGSVLSIPYAVDGLVPQLKAILG